MGAFRPFFYKNTRGHKVTLLGWLFFLVCVVMLTSCSPKERMFSPEPPKSLPTHPIIASPLAPSPLNPLPHGPLKRTVGLLLPLSGDHKVLGESLLKAIELALLDVKNQSIDLVIQDTGGTDQGAQQAMRTLFKEGPIDCILGPLLASEVSAITPLAWEKGIPILCFSNADNVAGNNVFIMGYSPKDQVDVLLDYASDHHLKSLLLIIPQSPYGTLIGTTVRHKITTLPSLTLFDTLNYADPRALADILSRIDFTSVDSILIPEGGEDLLTIIGLLEQNSSYMASKPKLLGSGQWDDEKLFSQPSLRGGVFPSTSLSAKEDFKDKFLKAFGVFPERLSALGYDGMKALESGLTQSVLEALLSPQGFDGADGHFVFHPSGLIQRTWQIYEISPSTPSGVVDLSTRGGFSGAENHPDDSFTTLALGTY